MPTNDFELTMPDLPPPGQHLPHQQPPDNTSPYPGQHLPLPLPRQHLSPDNTSLPLGQHLSCGQHLFPPRQHLPLDNTSFPLNNTPLDNTSLPLDNTPPLWPGSKVRTPPPPGNYAQAGGMHPTGTYSCFSLKCQSLSSQYMLQEMKTITKSI